MTDRFRALPDVLRLPLGAGEGLTYTPLSRRAEVLGHDDFVLLARCGRFATLNEHAARSLGPTASAKMNIGDTAARLRRLVARGLLVSEQDVSTRLLALARAEETVPITSVGLVTGGRNTLAIGAVQSVCESAAGPCELVVAHDATTTEERAELIGGVGALDVGPVSLRYAGPPERAAYATRLAARAGVDAQLVTWALTRSHPGIWSVGMLRNTLLFDSIGGVSLQLDDDVRSEVADPPMAAEGVSLTSADGLTEVWFPEPGCAAESLVSLTPTRVASIHERLLGRTLGGCLTEPVDWDDASGIFLRDVLAGRGRVRCTQMGLAGDAATGSVVHYLMLRGSSRERLLADEATYRHAFESRQSVRAPRRVMVSDGTFCMSYTLGLDGRDMLPPFVPSGRNADGVFGFMLRLCFRDSYFGYLPEVVAHRPPPRSTTIAAMIAELRRIDVNDLLCRIVGASGMKSNLGEPDNTLEAVGAHLMRLGELALPDLEEMVRTLLLRTRSRDLAVLRRGLEQHGARPSFWARDVEAVIERLTDVALDAGHTYPADLVLAFGEEAGRAALSKTLYDYGRLLQAWPALHAAARSLRAQGVRPSIPWP